MRVQAFVSSAVIGLAAVSVGMPLINERSIVTIGKGQAVPDAQGSNGGTTPSSSTAASSSTSVTTYSTTPIAIQSSTPAAIQSATQTFNNGQWSPSATPLLNNNGQYNATEYSDVNKFDDGQYHPKNRTMVETGSGKGQASNQSPSSVVATPLPSATGDSSAPSDVDPNGTAVSGGVSIFSPGWNRQSTHDCTFFIFCSKRR